MMSGRIKCLWGITVVAAGMVMLRRFMSDSEVVDGGMIDLDLGFELDIACVLVRFGSCLRRDRASL